jgi:uridine phosphorylase
LLANLNQSQKPLEPSELILNPDGSVYHIKLKPEHLADTVIVVGDQNRVERVSRHFSTIEHKISNREFVTHTGYYKGKRITVMSTGIGPDNMDIAINELDALVNIDLETRIIKEKHTSLNIIRIGTSGALQADIPVDSYLVSTHGFGFDGIAGFYDHTLEEQEQELTTAFNEQVEWKIPTVTPYFSKGNSDLINLLSEEAIKGITLTGSGFYGPQGRVLRINTKQPDLNDQLRTFNHSSNRFTNFEMETSALYGLCGMLGHKSATICAIIANRAAREYSKDYKKTVDELIVYTLDKLILI